jgi:hypothetical protein
VSDEKFKFFTRWVDLHEALWVEPEHREQPHLDRAEARYREAVALLEQRDRMLEDWLNSTVDGGNRPYSTFVIAADNSYAPGNETADYVCDGVADHVEIQAAIDVCNLSSTSGRVLLLEGDYAIDTDEVTLVDVTLAGLGRGVTRLNVYGAGEAVVLGDGAVLEDMTVIIAEDAVGWSLSGGVAKIRRVDFETSGGV